MTESLWSFSLRVYGLSGVSAACLRLQDDHGLDVNVALWCCWAAADHPLQHEDLVAAVQSATTWTDAVVGPLRGARRWMKQNEVTPLGTGHEELRQRLKGVELHAERLEQQLLEALLQDVTAQRVADPAEQAFRHLQGYVVVLGMESDPVLDVLFAQVVQAAYPAPAAVGPHPIVQVDSTGGRLGVVDRLDAHRPPGTLHLAVSLQVLDDSGRWLLQQRAAGKELFAGRWANTCCTHPRPDEDPVETVRRRVTEELGVSLKDIEFVGSFIYHAVDESTGMVEHEWDRVYLARVEDDPALNADPAEVAQTRWMKHTEVAGLADSVEAAPWFAHVVQHVLDHLANRSG